MGDAGWGESSLRKFLAAKFIAYKESFILFFLLGITFLSFYSSLSNGFTSWDDPYYVLTNLEIRGLDWNHLKTMFTSTTSGGYIPLTTFSYAIEYHFFELNPFIYHLDNLILHLAVTALIFFLGLRLKLDVWASGLAALLFGIHPMHVESVAWVTERKDVLYSVFYMLALHSYWSYLETGRKTPYALAIVYGLLSMMAKPMALSLPLIFLILDWMKGRKITFKVLLEKIPHFLYIIPIALITFCMHVEPIRVPLQEVFLTWIWCSVFYIWKFIFPTLLVPLYTRPDPVSLFNPVYLTAVLSVILFILIVIRFRTHRWLMFAALFYVLSVFFLFHVDVSEFNVVADRYMYLPSVGFCFLFGFWMRQGFMCLSGKGSWQKMAAILCLMVLFGSLSVKTFIQCRVWKDGMTLLSTMIAHNPNSWFVLYNRGKTYEDQGKFDLALADYDRAISIKPDLIWAYNNRGTMFLTQGRLDKAFEDLSKAIELDPAFADLYVNRSLVFFRWKQYDLALADLKTALKFKPRSVDAYVNQGLIYSGMKRFDLEIESYDRGLQIDSSNAALYYFRSYAYANLEKPNEALRDALKAQGLGYLNLDQYIQVLKKHASSN